MLIETSWKINWAWLGWAGLGSAGLGSTQLDLAWLGGSAQFGSAQLGSTRLNLAWLNSAYSVEVQKWPGINIKKIAVLLDYVEFFLYFADK